MELHELTALELGEQLRAGAVTQEEAIAASAARIAAAQAGGRAAEGLDFRGMVVRFIFEEDQPLFRHRAVPVIHFHRNDDGTGVDLVGLLHVLQLALLLQPAHGHQRKIHQADELVGPVF